ncbi:hypothetical protein [Brevundimonas sp. NIBR11]|uniref:hypothetical protein n=1 Tax=Brevundimonas sp. NIBR11 TaxID=3015999 RepID=UPI0022F11DBF|nr:hypothetical protein [Brevundimonas sp. NIBR11]WGM31484.1 hypothetical protein KKHFBJBL_01731 [Brevundimonas sp. NIBR11]
MNRVINPELDNTKRGIAAMITALVHTMNETDPTFQRRFLARLDQAEYSRRNSERPAEVDEMELYSWTSSFITGFDFVTGKGDPLYTGD